MGLSQEPHYGDEHLGFQYRDCGRSLLNGQGVSQIQRAVCAGGCIGVMSAKTPRQSLRRWHRDCMSVSGAIAVA